MSSVTKALATSTSPVTSSSRPGSNSRLVSSSYGSISELSAQSGVNGEGEQPSFEEFGSGNGHHQDGSQHQPKTLKLLGTSRTFAMLFEDVANDFNVSKDEQGYFDNNGNGLGGKPAFQAYMTNATSTYDLSTRVISGESKNRGGSLNIRM
jgi:hypothetical protein